MPPSRAAAQSASVQLRIGVAEVELVELRHLADLGLAADRQLAEQQPEPAGDVRALAEQAVEPRQPLARRPGSRRSRRAAAASPSAASRMWFLRTTISSRAQAGSRESPRISAVGADRVADDLLLGLAGDVDLDPAGRRARSAAAPPRAGARRGSASSPAPGATRSTTKKAMLKKAAAFGTPASVGIAARKIDTAPRRPTQEMKSFSLRV